MSAESKLSHVPPSHSSVLLSVSRSAAPPSLNCCCCCSLTAGGGSSPTCCANLLLQCLQHTDQLAFKYVVRRVSELQGGPAACTGRPRYRPGKPGVQVPRSGIRRPGCRPGETELRGVVFLPALLHCCCLPAASHCSRGRHICSVSRAFHSSWIVAAAANLVMFSNFARVM